MKVSVIIPSYNHHEYVGQAINSVLDQTWKDIDLIVIDDGSTDNSVDVINKILDCRGGFRFISRKTNKGLISSLNTGLQLAEGAFFCELASDDFLPVDSIEKRVQFFSTHSDYVALFSDGLYVEENKITDHSLYDAKRRLLFSKSDPVEMMLHGVLPIFATGMFKTDTARDLGGFSAEFRCYEDLEMPVLLFLAGKVGFLDEKLFFRRHHKTNTSTITSTIRTDKIIWYEKLLKNKDLHKYKSILQNQLRRSYLALGRHLTSTGGGTSYDRGVFRNGWRYSIKDLRLLYHLLKWGRENI